MNGIRALLEHKFSRLIVGTLIVISVLPFRWVERDLNHLFLAVFGLELALRLSWMRTEKNVSKGEWAFLLFDVLALASFLPLDHWFGINAAVLRALRVVRLLVLFRFIRELAFDVYSVLTRREQLQQLGLVTAAVVSLSFVGAVFLGQLRVPHDYDTDGVWNQESFWEQMWWAFRQVESPDNLVATLSAHPAALAVSMVLTITGIFVFSYLIGLGTNIVEEVLRAGRRRALDFERHTLLIGSDENSETLVREFVNIYEKNRELRRIGPKKVFDWLFRGHPRPRRQAGGKIALLGEAEKGPSFLYEPQMRRVLYRSGDPSSPVALTRAAAQDAKRAVIISDGTSEGGATTLARLAAFREANESAHVFVEVVDPENLDLVARVGGAGTFPLNVSKILGRFLCHHLLVEGMDQLIAELLTAQGSEIYTHLFADEAERATLLGLGETVAADALAATLLEKHGVTLLGVFLADEEASASTLDRGVHDLLSLEGLRVWLNPLAAPENEESLGALSPGTIPVNRLRGVVGIAETYTPLQRASRSIARLSKKKTKAGEGVLAVNAPPRIQRLVIVGFGAGIGAMIETLSFFVRNVQVEVLAAHEDEASLRQELSGLEVQISLHFAARDRLVQHGFEKHLFQEAEAVAFLSPESLPDADALVAQQALRFASLNDSSLRVLIELREEHRRAPLRANLRRISASPLDLVFVSTEQVKNYFMVHAAFVPGSTLIYDRLLGPVGQEVAWLPGAISKGVSHAELRAELAEREMQLIAVRSQGKLAVNPPADARWEPREFDGVYVLTDADQLYAEGASNRISQVPGE